MNKAQLIDLMSARFTTRADAARALDTVLEAITAGVAVDGKVAIQGFGTFERRARPERQVRNPATGEPMTSPATHVTRFRPGSVLKDAVAAKSKKRTARLEAFGGPFVGRVDAAPSELAADKPKKSKDKKDKGKKDKKSKKK